MTNMLTNFIIQHSDVKREDADIIAFGVKYGLITLAEILGMVVISFLMRELIPGAVILIAFISPLKSLTTFAPNVRPTSILFSYELKKQLPLS